MRYESAMISPNGFGNQGVYVYGTAEEVGAICDKLNCETGERLYDHHHHHTIDNARKTAEKNSRATGDAITENYTAVMSAAEYFEEEV